jgi:hypothetical protein
MRRVTQAHVLRAWLRMERRGLEADPASDVAVETLSERELLDRLLDRNPGAAAFVWRDAPITWYETTLDRDSFANLRPVEGPEGLGWRALSPDGTVLGAARRIASGDPDELAGETGVDVARILRFREEPPDGPLILSTRRGCVPRYVADGNHRAVALALDLLAGEPWRPQQAYLGVGTNPVGRPLLERVCGFVRGVLD